MNQDLYELYAADQADRRSATLPPDLWERDLARRRRVEALMAEGALQSAEDYFHAAMVFQHGSSLGDYWKAHELAKRAAQWGAVEPARWLSAAAYDRWLTQQGKPQKYGTQYHAGGERWVLTEVDPATTDAERAEWNVPPLAEAHRRAEEMTRRNPPQYGGPAPLAALAIKGLTVHVIPYDSVTRVESPAPSLSPLDAPLPFALPSGLRPCRLPNGFGAIDPTGQLMMQWCELPIPLGEPFLLSPAGPDEPAPTLEPVDLQGTEAILMYLGKDHRAVIWRGPEQTCLLVSGRAALVDLLAVASGVAGNANGGSGERHR